MKLHHVALIVLLIASDYAGAAPPPAARPLHVVAKTASGIALVTIGSAAVDFAASSARYQIEVGDVLRGSLRQECLIGPLGLKVGRKYVVFLDVAANDHECGEARIAGAIEPSAFEVDIFGSDDLVVRLDHRRIIAPKFSDSIEIKQELELDGEVYETVLGTMVPLKTFLGYVTQGRSADVEPPSQR
jgi:hypothetical protein